MKEKFNYLKINSHFPSTVYRLTPPFSHWFMITALSYTSSYVYIWVYFWTFYSAFVVSLFLCQDHTNVNILFTIFKKSVRASHPSSLFFLKTFLAIKNYILPNWDVLSRIMLNLQISGRTDMVQFWVLPSWDMVRSLVSLGKVLPFKKNTVCTFIAMFISVYLIFLLLF